MNAPRLPLGTTVASGVVAAITSWMALTAWSDLVASPSSYLGRLAVVALVIAAVGIGLRAIGTPAWATALAETLAAIAVVTFQISGSPVPLGSGWSELSSALDLALTSANTYAPPISSNVPPVWPLLVLGGAAVVVLVDMIACTFRRVPVAGLALLASYSVPSGLLDDRPNWITFVVVAIGFMALLHLNHRDQVLHWGPTVGPRDAAPWRTGNPVREATRAGVGRIAVAATALALALPTFIPVLELDAFELGDRGSGGDIQIRKPIIDMRRDLNREEDVPLINVRTDDPDPSYLRVSVLNRFTGDEWSSGDRDVDSDNRADGRLPDPIGLSDAVPRRAYDYQVRINKRFNSTWLPTQFPATSVRADGDWRYDPTTLDFLAADDGLDTRATSYTMSGLTLEYGTDGQYFGNPSANAVPEELLDLPPGMPPVVARLARSVTAPATSSYERARLLQRWFRVDGGFTYSVKRAPRGTGTETLETFLSPENRIGYCEQYASAMAVMARVLGIPARVAVGFLRPTQQPDGSWEYSSHDLHAWPELYFDKTGWVRFEPTPPDRARSVPDYSRVPVRGIGEDITANPSGATNQPGDPASRAAPSREPTLRPGERDPSAAGSSGEGDGKRGLLVSGALMLLVVALALGLFGPRELRRRARHARLAGDAEQVWGEVRASAIDLGLPWPQGRSPREIGEHLAGLLGDPDAADTERPRTGTDVAPEASAALTRLVDAVEHRRYARSGGLATAEATTTDDGVAVIAALTAGVPARARRRAAWFPRTVWQR